MKQLIAILGTFCALTTLSAEVKVATQPLTYKVDSIRQKMNFS
jgi:hypothetical protein